jgi:hypothetical protein
MYGDPAPYHDHFMTQKPCTKPTGRMPMCRQAAKSGTVSPELNEARSSLPAASGGRSVVDIY